MSHRAHQGDEVRQAMAGVPVYARKSLIAVLCGNELGAVARNNHVVDFHCIKGQTDGPVRSVTFDTAGSVIDEASPV